MGPMHRMGWDSAASRSEVPTPAAAWRTLEKVTLSERCQMQRPHSTWFHGCALCGADRGWGGGTVQTGGSGAGQGLVSAEGPGSLRVGGPMALGTDESAVMRTEERLSLRVTAVQSLPAGRSRCPCPVRGLEGISEAPPRSAILHRWTEDSK